MPDYSDWTPNELRWAITTGNVKDANIADPLSAVKDVGHPNGVGPASEEENNFRAALFLAMRMFDEDMLPGLHAQNGLGADADLSTDAVVTAGPSNFAVTAAAGRFWADGQWHEVAETEVSYSQSTLGGGTRRYDWVIIDVDAGSRTAQYDRVEGTVDRVLPALAANQHPIGWYSIQDGPGGSAPEDIFDTRYAPAQPRSRYGTKVYGLGDISVNHEATTVETDLDAGTLALGAPGIAVLPIDLPIGTVLRAVRLRGLKDTPAGATHGFDVTVRRREIGDQTGTPTNDNLATASNGADGLSSTPFVIEITSFTTDTIDQGYNYEVLLENAAAGQSASTAPFAWSIEVDYTLPQTRPLPVVPPGLP